MYLVSMSMDPGTWSVAVAAAVRAEMTAQRRSVGALAQVLGITGPTLRKRLDGQIPFDLVEIERVATWLGLTPTALFDRVDVR